MFAFSDVVDVEFVIDLHFSRVHHLARFHLTSNLFNAHLLSNLSLGFFLL